MPDPGAGLLHPAPETTVGADGRPVWANGAAAARLAELYAEHIAMVLGVCRTFLHGSQEAEDAAQQAFLSAYKCLLRGGEPLHPSAWLWAIARHECLLRLQKERPTSEVDEGWADDGVADA